VRVFLVGEEVIVHEFPETRNSLLLKLQDSADCESWHEFVAIYRPVVYRMARRRGMQDTDAQDLAQAVLISVADSVACWQIDPQRARFRTWLVRVARNAIIDAFRRKRPDVGEGGTTQIIRLQQQPVPDHAEIDTEHRRELFRWAARQVRWEFAEETWLAFWRTAVETKPVQEVAKDLGKSPGAIYIARSRVMRRLQERVREVEHNE
jgi:RNA polymerase sigma factor (sigma-70 family)